MSNALIAWIVAIGLGAAVVSLGLRRNLGNTTRNWLPRFEGPSERPAAEPVPPPEGWSRRGMSARQRRWGIRLYLLASVAYAALAILSGDDRSDHAIFAGIWAVGAVMLWVQKPST
jgi:hypothetical protein